MIPSPSEREVFSRPRGTGKNHWALEATNPGPTHAVHTPKGPDRTASAPSLQESQGTEEHAE